MDLRLTPSCANFSRRETVRNRSTAMRPVYVISGGITKFAKANPTKDFRLMVKEALDYYYANKEWIDAEVDAEARACGLR